MALHRVETVQTVMSSLTKCGTPESLGSQAITAKAVLDYVQPGTEGTSMFKYCTGCADKLSFCC